MKRLFAVHARRKWPTFFSAGWRRVDRVLFLGLVTLAVLAPFSRAEVNERRITLREALALAEENAFEIKAARHDSLSAEHGLRAAKSAWFPTLGLTGNALGFHPQDPLGIGPIALAPRWNEIYATNLRLSYPIYTGGRRTNDIRLKRETVFSISSQLDAARLANAYECRQAYIGLLIAERVLKSAEASRKRVEIIQGHVENLFAVGMADSIDVLETEISIRAADRLLEEIKNRRRNASTRLARLLGLPDGDTLVPTEPVPEPAARRAAETDTGVDVSRRPELSALDHQVASARYRRSIVKAALLPAVNGLGGWALARPEIGEGEAEWQDIWWLGLTLSWDINLGGKEFSESRQALEAVRSLEMKRRDVEDSLALQARIARNNIDEAFAVYTISRSELGLATRRFALAEEKQKAGGMSVNALLELEAELTQTEQQFEAARLEYFAALTDYFYAVGSDALREGL
jgi:outer membrane protein